MITATIIIMSSILIIALIFILIGIFLNGSSHAIKLDELDEDGRLREDLETYAAKPITIDETAKTIIEANNDGAPLEEARHSSEGNVSRRIVLSSPDRTKPVAAKKAPVKKAVKKKALKKVAKKKATK